MRYVAMIAAAFVLGCLCGCYVQPIGDGWRGEHHEHYYERR
jgi:hypothetical protein